MERKEKQSAEALKREREGLYWLTLTPGWGAVKIRRLGEHIGSYSGIFNIEEKELRKLDFIYQKEIEQFSGHKRNVEACVRELARLETQGIRFVTPLDADYPQRLRQICDYPMGLYVKGKLPDERIPTAAVIGARACSAYGRETARMLGRELAAAGVQVVSGLAAGVDGAGHRGALEAGGETFGVLGCGVDICYPRENYGLFAEMLSHGGVLSEYGLGEKPLPGNFPLRNRIISGLADVVVVVEARKRSGSLITVDLALEQGKDVFAVPGRLTDPLSEGCNHLIQQGAYLCTSPSDILEYLGMDGCKKQRFQKKSGKGLAKKEKMLYSCLDLQPKHLEEIALACALPVGECLDLLTELELRGYVTAEGGQYYGIKL